MNRKIWISLLLAITVLLAALPVQAAAAQPLEEKIINSYLTETEVDVSDCNVTAEQLKSLHTALYEAGELPWYASGKYEYTYDQETMQALTFTAKCLDKETYDRARYEQRLAEILQDAVFDGMSQWQICLSIHDALVVQSQYDESLVLNKGYDLLVGGTAVCRGYAEAYRALLTKVGIPCEIVSSKTMDHAWNLVYINDNWYHVDVTWADPTPNSHGRVSHEYFLLTDAEISAGDDPHYDWVTEHTCTDESYTDAFWKDVDSQICYPNDVTSYLIREEDYTHYICSRDEMTGEETLLYTVELEYMDIGAGRCGYPHVGLSLWNDRLWFSSVDTIYSMNPDGSDVVAEFAYDAPGNGKHIYGCYVVDDTIHLTLRNHEDERSVMEVPLADSGYHKHDYTETIIAPTCLENGMTVYTCSCGIRIESDHTPPAEHDYQVIDEKKATFFSSGYRTYTCSLCEDTDMEIVPQIRFSEWLFEDGYLRPIAIACCIVLVGVLTRKRSKKRT